MYEIAVRCLPLSMRTKVSNENVENVVKPPQKPVTNSNFMSPDKTTYKTPIRKLPITFTNNVAVGNLIEYFSNNTENRNLNIVPINPPEPAINILFIIVSKIFYMNIFASLVPLITLQVLYRSPHTY